MSEQSVAPQSAAANRPLTILVVDDEPIVRQSLGEWFREDGYKVDVAENARAGLKLVAENTYDIALIDIKMPGVDGIELQARLREAAPELSVIMMTAYASVETAVKALKNGAYDYIVKPFDPEELSLLVKRAHEHRSLEQENVRLKESLEAVGEKARIVGDSPAMKRVLDLVASVAPTDATVLVQGESGTGKELVAKAIHAASPRRFNPLVAVHCGALAEGVLESELFGHEKGAFTGARASHKGKFEQADGGTVFLDEIGDIGPRVQVDLLRVVEEKCVTRVGGKGSIPIDFRIVAATNRDLEAMVKNGSFREDLYYRLNVVGIEIPPLRERTQDIPTLAGYFLQRFSTERSQRLCTFSDEAMEMLGAYHWPGNARELQNAVERAVVLGKPPVLQATDLPHYVRRAEPRSAPRSLAEVQRLHILGVLEENDWNITKAARILAVDRSTLYGKIKKYGLERTVHGE